MLGSRRIRRLSLVLFLLVLLGLVFTPVRVSGPSMRPGITDGQVFVTAPPLLREPVRSDLVVFKEPDSGRTAVKRVMGMPGETVQIIGGDMFVDGKRFTRPIFGAEDLVPLVDASSLEVNERFSMVDNGFEAVGDRWRLEHEGMASLREAPRTGYLLEGEFKQGILPAVDLGIEVEYELEGPTAFLELVLRENSDQFVLQLSRDGTHLWLAQVNPRAETTIYETELARSSKGILFFCNSDKKLTVVLNGEILLDRISYGQVDHLPIDGLYRFAQVSIGGQGPFSLGRIRVGRDFYWDSLGRHGIAEPHLLSEDQYFLLGDDPLESRDSRLYGPVSRDQLQGVVVLRAWPPGKPGLGW